jgi:D-amino-acid dehydrogenase
MTDVIVIGAGVVGITTALQLRLAGLDVLLLDGNRPAAGASSGNAGALAVSEVLPLAEPGMLLKVPGWMLDPLVVWCTDAAVARAADIG